MVGWWVDEMLVPVPVPELVSALALALISVLAVSAGAEEAEAEDSGRGREPNRWVVESRMSVWRVCVSARVSGLPNRSDADTRTTRSLEWPKY